MQRPTIVVIEPYDSDWPSIAARTMAVIREACGALLLDVHHIGSTSVPCLPAKPIIDLMPVIPAFEDGLQCVPAMESLRYEYRGEYGISGRHYFVGRDTESGLVTHVHMLTPGHIQWRGHLVFRDYLRSHPDEAAAYATEKKAVAARVSRAEYPDAKASWVQAAIARAEVWALQSGWREPEYAR